MSTVDFKSSISDVRDKIISRKDKVACEEDTKNWMIIPLIRALGYDTESPEVRCEFSCDKAVHGKLKVDYAIVNEDEPDEPYILIEAKDCRHKFIADNINQLKAYFNEKPSCRLGILTNGLVWEFYTDAEYEHIMDTDPFHTIDMENINETDIDFLFNLTKDNFDLTALLAEQTTQSFDASFKDWLDKQAKGASDAFLSCIRSDKEFSKINKNLSDEDIKYHISRNISKLLGKSFIEPRMQKSSMSNKASRSNDTEYVKVSGSTVEDNVSAILQGESSNDVTDESSPQDKKKSTGKSGVFSPSECTKDIVTGAKPVGVAFEDDSFCPCRSWSGIHSVLCEYLHKTMGLSYDEISKKSGGVFQYSSDGFRAPKQCDKLYFEGHGSGETHVKTFNKLCQLFNCDADLVICSKEDYEKFQETNESSNAIYNILLSKH